MFSIQETNKVICDFPNNIGTNDWYMVNDGVMGGISEGKLERTDTGTLLYSGVIRTENNGGFSSIRHSMETLEVGDYTTIRLRLKGDGKDYQFRIRSSRSQRYAFVHNFKTTGDWQEVDLLLSEFYPSFRGRKLDKPNYNGQVMEEIVILIGNKKNESFTLELASIELIR
ncbi:MAG: CIA30 family protein [Flavobacteriaceae bacterium]|nr:CIA30 family protein [Flavobacteriaceae bacterium]